MTKATLWSQEMHKEVLKKYDLENVDSQQFVHRTQK